MIKRFARWILRKEGPKLPPMFWDPRFERSGKNGKDKTTAQDWQEVRGLVENDGWEFLMQYLYNEAEQMCQEIETGQEHRFWYMQGFKKCLIDLAGMREHARNKILFIAGFKEKKEAGADAGDPPNYS